jgi:titin
MLVAALVFSTGARAAVFEVTNARDSGHGSLRDAILRANATRGHGVIDFRIGTGPQTIAPRSQLPAISSGVVIDGTTQPGFAGVPLLKLDGSRVRSVASGIVFAGTASVVRALEITRWGGAGVLINGGAKRNTVGGARRGMGDVISGNSIIGVSISGQGTRRNVIEGDYIGVNPAGTAALGNPHGGVEIFNGATDNIIGGPTPAERNVISGNGEDGIDINDKGTTGNIVEGNYIGTNATGTAAIGNAPAGISIYHGASNNTIGGLHPGDGNVISGNHWYGVRINESGTSHNTVQGNYIGTNAAGTIALSNGGPGVDLYGGTTYNKIGGFSPFARNVISGNLAGGVIIADPGTVHNSVEGNYIGTDASGASAIGNGIMRGVISSAPGNVIAGNKVAV